MTAPLPFYSPQSCPHPRDTVEGKRHLPFQVLDASAIEGIRGLAGESSSIYSCIQIYKALTPPCPPPQRIDGRTWASILCGILRREEASESAPEAVRQAVGGGCQSGWGRLLSVTNAIEAGTWRQGDSGWA